MYASTIIALGAAALASAAPTTQQQDSFQVSKFVFGCTASCYYNFDVSFNDGSSYHCDGGLKETTDYAQCTGEGDEVLSAYIDTSNDKNTLKLQSEVSNANEGTRYNYYGEDQVYAVTSSDADKQEENFTVPVSSATGVAK